MAGPLAESPGWYPDPDISAGRPQTLRYWDGEGWTDRRRRMPIVGTLDLAGVMGLRLPQALEGPTHAPAMAAPEAEVSASREGPLARKDSPNRPVADRRGVDPPNHPDGGRNEPPKSPQLGDGRHGGGEPEPPVAGPKLRRKWWFIAAVAVVAALAVLVAAQALRPPSVGRRVLTDSHFVQLANDECAKTMPTLRPTDGGPLGSFTTPKQAADQIERAANGLDDLADRLVALPAAEVDRPPITAWLRGWHDYDSVGRVYATYLRDHGAPQKPPAFLAGAAQVARTVDGFARANGLKGCLFTFVFVSDPSQF